MVKTHRHVAVMEGVEVLLGDGILTEVDPPLFVLGMQGLVGRLLQDEALVNNLARKRLIV